MSQCKQCGKWVEDLYAVPGEYGKVLWVCDKCAGGESGPAYLDVTGQRCLRCPACGSNEYQDLSEVDRSWRKGELFGCKCGCVFEARTYTLEVRLCE